MTLPPIAVSSKAHLNRLSRVLCNLPGESTKPEPARSGSGKLQTFATRLASTVTANPSRCTFPCTTGDPTPAFTHAIPLPCTSPCLVVIRLARPHAQHCRRNSTDALQDNSDSDDESTGESGLSGRRFFNRKRRSTDTSLSFVDRGHPNTEGRLRRMSNVISRRPRTSSLPSTTTEGEAAGDRDRGHITASCAATGQDLRASGDEVEVVTSGAAAAAGASNSSVAQGAAAAGATDSNEEEDEEEDSLPPFTMALAVMLTGVRVFLVDQVSHL